MCEFCCPVVVTFMNGTSSISHSVQLSSKYGHDGTAIYCLEAKFGQDNQTRTCRFQELIAFLSSYFRLAGHPIRVPAAEDPTFLRPDLTSIHSAFTSNRDFTQILPCPINSARLWTPNHFTVGPSDFLTRLVLRAVFPRKRKPFHDLLLTTPSEPLLAGCHRRATSNFSCTPRDFFGFILGLPLPVCGLRCTYWVGILGNIHWTSLYHVC